MPKRSNDFQKLVTLINGCLKTSGKVEESALLIDRLTGDEREVDVFISSSIGDYAVNVSVEVIDRGRKADLSWIDAMHGKHAHLPTDKLVLVSRSGFTRPAIKKAADLGIEVISFEEAFSTDWDLAVRMSATGFFSVTNFNYKCTAVCAHPDGPKVYSPVKRSTRVYLPYRETPTDFDKMMEYFLEVPEIKEPLYKTLDDTNKRSFTFTYNPQPGFYVFDSDGSKMPLVKVSFEIEVEHTKSPVRFAIGRYGKRDVVGGTSTDPSCLLYFVLVRNEKGVDEGLLVDEKGLRKLSRSD
jgi:hypothetical protein